MIYLSNKQHTVDPKRSLGKDRTPGYFSSVSTTSKKSAVGVWAGDNLYLSVLRQCMSSKPECGSLIYWPVSLNGQITEELRDVNCPKSDSKQAHSGRSLISNTVNDLLTFQVFYSGRFTT